MIEEFRAHMDYEVAQEITQEKDRKVARFYLEDSGWVMEDALNKYREDLQWEKSQKAKLGAKDGVKISSTSNPLFARWVKA